MSEIELSEEEKKNLEKIDELFSELKTEIGLMFASGLMIFSLQKCKEEINDKSTFRAVKDGMCDFIKNYETLNENTNNS